jgi:hypothetical protein
MAERAGMGDRKKAVGMGDREKAGSARVDYHKVIP